MQSQPRCTAAIAAVPGTRDACVMVEQFYVYILASKRNGTLYVGVTSNIIDRIGQHKAQTFGGFTKEYGVDKLVYFEIHGSAEEAIRREKQLKKWNRSWKMRLIEETNPRWEDLYDAICQ